MTLAFVTATGGVLAVPQASAAAPAPGFVFTSTPVPGGLLPSGAARASRVVYATLDQNGRPAMSGGMVWTPHGTPPPGGWPIVSWAHGTTGIADTCAPSRIRSGNGWEAPIRAALDAGYAVTATDYAGLGAAGESEYLGGRAAAHSIVDLIRAARTLDPTLSERWVSVGHSQGGHAALFAARYARDYAPETSVRGVVAIAPVSSIEDIFGVFGPRTPSLGRFNGVSGLFLYILAGLDHARRDLDVNAHLTDTGRKYLDYARERCYGDLNDALHSNSPGSLVDSGFGSDTFRDALRDYAEVPTGGYGVPVQINHGFLDPVLPYAMSRSLRTAMADDGTDVTLKTYVRADHTSVVEQSLSDTMSAIKDDFARS
ncbi:alpha/beta fold hydrolase [Gordonia sp. ABSL1-1]|uniref:alpha/beta fold hydrolase n=1 Tax=Gordonia sp. ABSL1-1 TaxID=3053923 RepID=UPI002572F95D|nr:alpha/beta fold hydrolase [Gordonia sp. ABSL1-1]MDL9938214.1 alpha/beta fold hydrolase [Gordonia sp. ABSL1-1]